MSAIRVLHHSLTRRGVAKAVVLSMDEFETLQQFSAVQAPAFIVHLFNMPADDGEFERSDIQFRDFE
jgi:hypothetical protein